MNYQISLSPPPPPPLPSAAAIYQNYSENTFCVVFRWAQALTQDLIASLHDFVVSQARLESTIMGVPPDEIEQILSEFVASFDLDAERFRAFWRHLDVNDDGRVTRAEFQAEWANAIEDTQAQFFRSIQ